MAKSATSTPHDAVFKKMVSYPENNYVKHTKPILTGCNQIAAAIVK
ncbi:hypothetical protein I5476_11600 [Citrobacter braakii]|nr:hypothetical protein [Citrobacter braakii]MBJ9144696.1 hypothetical protein [Citrobacter braakii]